MKIALFITLAPFLFAMASTSRTHASVIVENNVTSVTNTNTDGTSKSHVRIETNGEVNEFNTTDNESVDWTSEDGKSSVKINSNGSTVKIEEGGEQTQPSPSESAADSSATPTHDEDPKVIRDGAKPGYLVPLTPISMIVTLVKSLISLL